jgi:hypothetical protein
MFQHKRDLGVSYMDNRSGTGKLEIEISQVRISYTQLYGWPLKPTPCDFCDTLPHDPKYPSMTTLGLEKSHMYHPFFLRTGRFNHYQFNYKFITLFGNHST